MNIVYAGEAPPETYSKAIFLAGPSPRGTTDENWRPAALGALTKLGYDGVVYIPLPREEGKWPANYDDQIVWETKYLRMCDQIIFWVPRDLKTLPAFTTNVEFGLWCDSGKITYGRPPSAPKMRYLDWHAVEEKLQVHETLEATLAAGLERIGAGSQRTLGEREVPLYILEHPSLQELVLGSESGW